MSYYNNYRKLNLIEIQIYPDLTSSMQHEVVTLNLYHRGQFIRWNVDVRSAIAQLAELIVGNNKFLALEMLVAHGIARDSVSL